MDRNVLMAVAAAQEAWDEAGDRGVRPGARRDPRRLRDRRHRDDRRAAAVFLRARRRPRLAVLHPLGARRHGERPDRDPARAHAARTTRRSRRARPARRRSARAPPRSCAARPTSCSRAAPRRRSRRSSWPASAPCAGSWPRRSTRRWRCGPFDATRAGFVMGEGACILVLEELEAARARGATIYAEVLGYGASNDAHHLAQPEPEATGVAAMITAALAAAGDRARARRLRQRARHVDAARRPRRDARAPPGLRRARVRAGRLVDEVGHGPLLRRRRRDRGDDVRAGAPPPGAAADDQLPEPRPGARPRLRAERGAPGRPRRRALERDGPRRPQRLRAARRAYG